MDPSGNPGSQFLEIATVLLARKTESESRFKKPGRGISINEVAGMSGEGTDRHTPKHRKLTLMGCLSRLWMHVRLSPSGDTGHSASWSRVS